MKKGLVSIIIPCYNGEKYIPNCFDSILKQDYKNIEVIICDDGSTDNSKKIIEKYINNSEKVCIKYIYQTNKGQAAAVNTALKYVEGEYIFWQDIDDSLENNAINMLVKCFKDDTDVVIGKCKYIYENGEIEYPQKKLNKKYIFMNYLFDKNIACYPGVILVKTKHFDERIANRNIVTDRGGQNWQLILPIVYKSNIITTDEIVYNYSIISTSHFHSINNYKKKIAMCDNHKKIITQTIRKIPNMGVIEKCLLCNLIQLKYFVKKIIFVIKSFGRME